MWNDKLQSFVAPYKNVKVDIARSSQVRSDDKLAVTNQIWYLDSTYETGSFVTYLSPEESDDIDFNAL
jgi:hypothetical protein